MNFDLLIPSHLLGALFPDIILMVGGMLLMLQAAWRPDSAAHQRAVGINAMVLIVITMAAVIYMALRGDTAMSGVIAVDSFRWAVDLVILLAALGTVKGVQTHDHFAELYVVRPSAQGDLLFSILMMRDGDGIWRIDAF